MSEYDAIVIGAGHHGTIIADYLAKAGMKIGVFERLDTLGGGTITEVGPLPGYKQDFCSHYTRFYSHPAYRTFNLYDEGLRYTTPMTGTGIVFDDGTSFVGYPAWVLKDPKTGETVYSEENVKKTYEQIARLSKRDAETYLELTGKNKNMWREAVRKQGSELPTPWGVPDPLEELYSYPDSGLEPVLDFMTVKQLAHYFFESPEMRILFIRNASITVACQVDDIPGLTGLYGILSVCFSWSPSSIAIGGSQTVTDALVSVGKKLGVEYFTNSDVDKIIIENGVARGIELTNKTRIRAKHLVVADVGIPQLMYRLLGEEYVAPKVKRLLDAAIYERGQVFEGHLAVNESPQYRAAESNPDVNQAFRLYWAYKDLRYYEDSYWHEISLMGFASRLNVLTNTDTLWDHTRAPEGKHNVWMEENTCPLRYFSYRDWRRIKVEFTEHMLKQWQGFASNMTKENIMGARVYTPLEYYETDSDMLEGAFCREAHIPSHNGRFRGLPGVVDYRTPVGNVYLCSSSAPGGLGIARPSSLRCYKVIAQDLGLPSF